MRAERMILALPRPRSPSSLPSTLTFPTVSGPELMNGRLAMVAFVPAAGAEISSGETVAQQFADAPAAVILTISMIIFGSLISYQANTEPSPVGPFTKEKELLNGRAAMVGMACLLGFDAVKHTALL